MFSCASGSYHAAVPSPEELRTGFGELLRGMLTDQHLATRRPVVQDDRHDDT
ncbi:hypothetical protein HRW23_06325 [Streptomyces lunaelactis]|uniref:hypothetical protein n=1 Tax=Streptomyces lunaelactis TaxID=1535768 RepID=UPI00158474CE|nr:hypothetical protein [Streptomyces lunaelactis]NUK01805.1 hypothetical protein [Streptomyces lunaelactis]NUK14959.1 hypothetical protein [Streptomyces lunaelactis]NUK51528.1 hypothetical protein [Streptomyces lunaelactis]NUK68055.1 hypothetical protein [Streptomyces lunaelactis]NUK77025.1 hypothetical protein [Streptomyces lunaelactis]